MPDTRSTSRSVKRPTKAQIDPVQHYLELEFPGQVNRTWWDRKRLAQVFEIATGAGLRHIVIELEFFQACSDYVDQLRDSELVDYIRESLSPGRCFLVVWTQGMVRIRSKPL